MLGFHVGTFLLFAAMALLIIVSVGTPIWDTVAFAKIDIPGSSDQTLAFGNFGYCIIQSGTNACSPKMTGYDIVDVLTAANIPNQFADATKTTLRIITRTFVLHPIAAGIAFLAWLTAAASHRIGFLFSSLIALVAAVVCMVALILDFVAFGIVMHHINNTDQGGPGSGAKYSTAIWLVVAAFGCLVLGAVTVCCGCFTDRRRRARSTY